MDAIGPLAYPYHHFPLLGRFERGVHELILSSVCVSGKLTGDPQLDI
jgi:hypothetical protein